MAEYRIRNRVPGFASGVPNEIAEIDNLDTDTVLNVPFIKANLDSMKEFGIEFKKLEVKPYGDEYTIIITTTNPPRGDERFVWAFAAHKSSPVYDNWRYTDKDYVW